MPEIHYICNRQQLKGSQNMEALTLVYAAAAIFGIGFLIWMKTPSGKKWLSSL